MTYKATAVKVTVLGVEFTGYKAEDGKVVYSQKTTADAFNIEPSTILRLRASKELELRLGKSSVILRQAVEHSRKPIAVVEKTELVTMVAILAERGNAVAQAMQQVSFAVALQQAEDIAFNQERNLVDYQQAGAIAVAALVEQKRSQLRSTSHEVTNPILACNLYAANNAFIFGEGFTRDSYQGDNKHLLLDLEVSLENFQAGLKVAGMGIKDIIETSHKTFSKQLSKIALTLPSS